MEGRQETENVCTNQRMQIDWNQVNWFQVKHQVERMQRFYRQDGSIKEFIYFPSRDRLDRFIAKLKNYIKLNWNVDVKNLIKGLNRRIRGFCNYFKWSTAYKAFSYLSYRIWELMWQWAKHRHRRKRSRKWIRNHYWKVVGNSRWIFSFKGVHLVEPYTLTAQ